MVRAFLAFLSIAVFGSVAAAGDLLEGQKEFPPLSEDIAQAIAEATLSGKPLDIKEPVQIFPAEDQLHEFWLGNRPILTAEVKKISYTFEMQGVSQPGAIQNVMQFVLNKSDIVIQHSRAAFPGQRGGIRVDGEKHFAPHRFLYRALQGSSVVVLVPNFSRREKDRAIVFCPRDFDVAGSRKDKSRLIPTQWRPKEVALSVSGDVRGVLRSSTEMVKAHGEIKTSPNVTPGIGWQDQIYSKNAGISLFYKPRPNFKPPGLEGKNSAEGIEVSLDLHANTDFRRISRLPNLSYLHYIDFPDFEVAVKLKDLGGTAVASELAQRGIPLDDQKVIGVDVVAGGCYLVLNDTGTIIHEYLKESLPPPNLEQP